MDFMGSPFRFSDSIITISDNYATFPGSLRIWTLKGNKNDEYQNINFIQYDKNKNIYNIKTSQGSSLNISISITEIKNMIDFLKYNDSYILNNYTIISTDNK